MRSMTAAWATILLSGALTQPAFSADTVVLGKRLLVKDPTGAEANRTVLVLGREPKGSISGFDSTVPLTASLQIVTSGGTPSDAAYLLGAVGTWTESGPGGSGVLRYRGGDPVRLLLLKQSGSGAFVLKAKLKGSVGPEVLDVVPPDPGAEGGMLLTLNQPAGVERFCVAFGGSAGGTSVRNSSTFWKVVNPEARGCPFALESVEETVNADETVSTDTEADGATPDDPLETAVTTPGGGTVRIDEGAFGGTPPAGHGLVGQQADVTAPPSLATDPLTLVFLVDLSVIPAGRDPLTLQVFRDGLLVPPCVGGAGKAFPDPCVAERTIVGDDLRVTALGSHASRWSFGLPLCGNGVVDPGESCDPPGTQSTCGAGLTCKSTCECAAVCDCCALGPELFEFTSTVGAGTCGTVTQADGSQFQSIDCNDFHFGGGQSAYPSAPFTDAVTLTMKVTSCDSATERLTLAATTAGQTGNARTCTGAGCLFGPPLPIPNPSSTPTSTCLLWTLSQDASGTSSCEGDTEIIVPLEAELFLTGDDGPESGIQSCPICTGPSGFETCSGGPNDGQSCVPGSSDLGDPYPTSHDCPPDPTASLGTFPLGAQLSSGTVTATAAPSGTQQRVFCGYCRDADLTLAFQDPPEPCLTDAECAQPFESCEQRNQGAFGPGGASVQTITLTGASSGCHSDFNPRPMTLVGGTCFEPNASPTVNAAIDLPGPAALSLQGDARVTASAPCCGAATPATLTLTTGIGSGSCGTTTNGDGTTFKSLACGDIYFGGGQQSFPQPAMNDLTTSVAKVLACNADVLTLGATTAGETGSTRTCTGAGCLFGAPNPLPNPSSTPTSVCLVNRVTQSAAGTADCATGAVDLDLPLDADLYLNGDLSTATPGIQACPTCTGPSGFETCDGGPNDGQACTPGTSATSPSHPTSHDCPSTPSNLLGPMRLPLDLTTSPIQWTAAPSGSQSRVFCGYCRDFDVTINFADPAEPCLENGAVTGACAQPFESCEQRNQGAFGPAGGFVQTITVGGALAGSLTDHAPHAATLASISCVPPSFDPSVDAALDLPGPAAVTLPVTVQVQ